MGEIFTCCREPTPTTHPLSESLIPKSQSISDLKREKSRRYTRQGKETETDKDMEAATRILRPLTPHEKGAPPETPEETRLSKELNSKCPDNNKVIKLLMALEDISADRHEFLVTIAKDPAAVEQYILLHRALDRPNSELVSVGVLAGRNDLPAMINIHQGYQETSLKKRVDDFKKAVAYAESGHKSDMFFSSAVNEHIKVLREQGDLRQAFSKVEGFMETSLVETIGNLIRLQSVEPRALLAARAIAKAFAISEKRFWYITIKAMAETNQWQALIHFATLPSSPPIFAPILQEMIRAGQFVAARELHRKIFSRCEGKDKLRVERLVKDMRELEAQEEHKKAAAELKANALSPKKSGPGADIPDSEEISTAAVTSPKRNQSPKGSSPRTIASPRSRER